MKKNRLLLILGLGAALTLFCSKKDKVTNPIDTRAGHQIAINPTVAHAYGLDSLLIGPGATVQLKASTLLPATAPDYEWSAGNSAIILLNAVAGDSSLVNAVAVGDSGASTTITIKDLANSQEKSIVVKVAVWANMDQFDFVGTLNKHHYFVSKGVADWASAKTKCEDNHGHLVTITSAEENSLVKKAVEKAKDEAWIGLRFQFIFDEAHPTDRSKDKKWTEWITGELVSYSNWDSGKPDFTTYNQDWETRYFACMVATGATTGKWTNRRAMTKYYVLEIP